jgi:hypothetical protein
LTTPFSSPLGTCLMAGEETEDALGRRALASGLCWGRAQKDDNSRFSCAHGECQSSASFSRRGFYRHVKEYHHDMLAYTGTAEGLRAKLLCASDRDALRAERRRETWRRSQARSRAAKRKVRGYHFFRTPLSYRPSLGECPAPWLSSATSCSFLLSASPSCRCRRCCRGLDRCLGQQEHVAWWRSQPPAR